MTTVAIIAASVAFAGFCAMHTIKAILTDIGEKRRNNEREQLRKALHDEICNGGNLARVTALRARLLKLGDE